MGLGTITLICLGVGFLIGFFSAICVAAEENMDFDEFLVCWGVAGLVFSVIALIVVGIWCCAETVTSAPTKPPLQIERQIAPEEESSIEEVIPSVEVPQINFDFGNQASDFGRQPVEIGEFGGEL